MIVIFFGGLIGTAAFGPLSAVNDSLTASRGSLISSAGFSLILLFFPRADRPNKQGGYPGLLRRFFAAHIDMGIAGHLFLVCLFFALLLVENIEHETWIWSWEQAQFPYYMPVFLLGILVSFIGIYFYFRLHLERGRATPGQYIMGYKIVPTGEPNYNLRIWNGLFFLWLWIFAWMARTETEGIYKWDKISNSQAIRTK